MTTSFSSTAKAQYVRDKMIEVAPEECGEVVVLEWSRKALFETC